MADLLKTRNSQKELHRRSGAGTTHQAATGTQTSILPWVDDLDLEGGEQAAGKSHHQNVLAGYSPRQRQACSGWIAGSSRDLHSRCQIETEGNIR